MVGNCRSGYKGLMYSTKVLRWALVFFYLSSSSLTSTTSLTALFRPSPPTLLHRASILQNLIQFLVLQCSNWATEPTSSTFCATHTHNCIFESSYQPISKQLLHQRGETFYGCYLIFFSTRLIELYNRFVYVYRC